MVACPVGDLGARPEDAAAMRRVAFPLPPAALRALGDLAAWERESRGATEVFARHGRAGSTLDTGARDRGSPHRRGSWHEPRAVDCAGD
eukprot:8491337-Alexandrium_andersonii.AAC.1